MRLQLHGASRLINRQKKPEHSKEARANRDLTGKLVNSHVFMRVG